MTPKHILVIRFSSLGDVVLTVPVYRRLKEIWPDARVTALTRREYADALKGQPGVDVVMEFARSESLGNLLARIRAEKFDLLIDLHGSFRSRVLSLLSGIPKRVRSSRAVFARRLMVWLKRRGDDLDGHVLERYLDVFPRLGILPAPRKVLLVQTGFLGDAVLTLPLMDAFRRRFPDAQLSLLCTPEIREVYASRPGLQDVLVFDKRRADRGWGAMIRRVSELRSRGYDCAILPHRSFRSAFLCALAGIPTRIGFARGGGQWLLTVRLPFEWGRHDAERNVSLLAPFGSHAGSTAKIELKVPKDVHHRIDAGLARLGIPKGKPILGISPGSVWPTKRWLPEGFAASADRASRELGMAVVLFGSKADQPAAARVVERMSEKAFNLCGETSLADLIGWIERCSVFLTNDSGPMHLAVGLQVPVVAIFGPTTRDLGFFPYGEDHIVLERKLDCRPCGLHGHQECPLGHFMCMKEITADRVFEAVKQQGLRGLGSKGL